MLNPEDDLKLKTICEYLFFDHLKNEATFPRFEQCFPFSQKSQEKKENISLFQEWQKPIKIEIIQII